MACCTGCSEGSTPFIIELYSGCCSGCSSVLVDGFSSPDTEANQIYSYNEEYNTYLGDDYPQYTIEPSGDEDNYLWTFYLDGGAFEGADDFCSSCCANEVPWTSAGISVTPD